MSGSFFWYSESTGITAEDIEPSAKRKKGQRPAPEGGCRFVQTVVLLIISNVFMTFAWYGHLRFKQSPLWIAIFASWGIAFMEYCFQVPANRMGHGRFTAAELKTIQEIITLTIFCAFSVLYLKEGLKWNHLVGFALIAGAAFFIFKEW